MAAACLHVMNLPEDAYWGAVQPMQSHINIGTGQDCGIRNSPRPSLASPASEAV